MNIKKKREHVATLSVQHQVKCSKDHVIVLVAHVSKEIK